MSRSSTGRPSGAAGSDPGSRPSGAAGSDPGGRPSGAAGSDPGSRPAADAQPGGDGAGVRRAQLRDLDRVAALWTGITRHHEPIDPVFRMRAGADGELRELLGAIHRDSNSAILVFDDAGDLPGLCIVRIDSAPPIMQENERAEITDLGVREDARRRGIASLLVEAAFDWIRASGVARVEVHVASANAEGQAFWRARGFGDLMDVLHKRL